jgi:hypothetical protein
MIAADEPVLLSTEYTLVIDTNSFSYAFAKKLCAYCTGFTDEEDEGREFADLFYLDEQIEDDESPKGKVADEKNPFYGYVNQRLDENQVYSPCCVWLNKHYGYNASGEYAKLTAKNFNEFNFPAPLSVGIFFDVEPQPEHVKIVKDRVLMFFEKIWPKVKDGSEQVLVEGFRLITHTKFGIETDL